ncbi:MAG: hypothetical protein RIR26_2859 [Pseudomonadota bacterium]|jgi:hypothetical protein
MGNLFIRLMLVAGIATLAGCGKSSDGTSTPSVLSTGSCDVPAAMTCTELQSATAVESYKTSCAQSGGTYSATSGCKTAGRISGCEFSSLGVKTVTIWYYEQDMADAQAAQCPGLSSASVTTKVVKP